MSMPSFSPIGGGATANPQRHGGTMPQYSPELLKQYAGLQKQGAIPQRSPAMMAAEYARAGARGDLATQMQLRQRYMAAEAARKAQEEKAAKDATGQTPAPPSQQQAWLKPSMAY